MGFGGISVGSLLLILAIVVLLFGTKKLPRIGKDLGCAMRSFKQAMGEGQPENSSEPSDAPARIRKPDSAQVQLRSHAARKEHVAP